MNNPTSIDPKEKAQFEKIAGLWWQPDGPFWPLHALNDLRVVYIQDQLIRYFNTADHDPTLPLKGLRILDVGCGGGILSEAIARLGGEVTGIDMISKNVAIARLHASASGLSIDYQVATAEDLLAEDRSFDVVLNMEVIEHVADAEQFIKSCAGLVRPGGIMVVATLNRTLLSFIMAIIGAERVLRWLPLGTHQWRKFVTPSELERYLLAQSMKVIGATGVSVNPLTRQFRRVNHLAVNYMMVAAKGLHGTTDAQ